MNRTDLDGGLERLTGWGRTAPTVARVLRPLGASAAQRILGAPIEGRAVAFRGLGRSYGDSAQSAGGAVIETTRMNAVLEFDPDNGTLRAEAGLSIDRLLRTTVREGWFVPVTPGTRHVTLGGAVAADVHGKNHHRDGSLGAHVRAIRLITPDGDAHDLTPGMPLFDATVGGMGLTGLISEVTLQLFPVSTSFMTVETARASNLDDLLRTLTEHDGRWRYSVAWIDCLSTGSSFGRGVVTSGDHADRSSLPPRTVRDPLRFAPVTRFRTPGTFPTGALNRASVRAFNEAWFRRAPTAPRVRVEHSTTFFHPLDGIADWNRIYGPRGFLQYQYVMPYGQEEAVAASIRLLAQSGAASFLGVLKRFGAEGSGMLSFPMPGWTLALDLPLLPGLSLLLARLDHIVLKAGGRLYLAKDARMPRRMIDSGYPRLEEFREVRRSIDPHDRLTTDQSRRLGL